MNLLIDRSVLDRIPGFSLGMIQYADTSVSESPKMLQGRINLFFETLRLEKNVSDITSIEGVSQWRAAFKSLGIDPSRYRPSSEALLRRILQGNTLHWVNSAVDVNNFLSVTHALPYGIYDMSKISGSVVCRLGQEADQYAGINGREVGMNGKLLLADDTGAFGSPIVDSTRTMVTESATNLMQVIFFHPTLPLNQKETILGSSARMFTEINGGEVVLTKLVAHT
ncbi:B3/B4 domain-containing protein [Brevibacillus sp. SYSU BS000544]|uniref:B3/B4 domain-containing protein n=1 Tax=Brevibacillus sp. SYSU BS000544 TaxID=3416443 RepID=UPI003CE48F2B